MSILFGVVFAIFAIALLIYLGYWLRDQFSRQRTARAVLKVRKKQNFPMSAAFVRRDRTEYFLVFLVDGEDKERQFEVKDAIYQSYTTGSSGVLTWKGGRFLSFLPDYDPAEESRKEGLPEDEEELLEEDWDEDEEDEDEDEDEEDSGEEDEPDPRESVSTPPAGL